MSTETVEEYGTQRGFAYVNAKLANQRKVQHYLVSPTSDGRIMVQSDKSIGMFDFRTRQGVLNTKGCYFPHLSAYMGAKPYEYPRAFVSACLEVCPALDSEIEIPGGIMQSTVEIIGGES